MRGLSPAELPSHAVPCQLLHTAQPGQPWCPSRTPEGGTRGAVSLRLLPGHGLEPQGPQRKLSWCSVEKLAAATRRGPGAWRGALCVYVGSGAVLAAPVLCVTLPSRVKSCQTSDPREPQPKLQRGGGKEAERPGAEHGRLLVAGWVCPREPEGRCHFPSHPSHCRQPSCFPDALCLGTLPQNMQYVWVTCPTPTPHPGSP